MRIRKDSRENGWNCAQCDLNFRTRRELDKHRKSIHLCRQGKSQIIKEYNCIYCGLHWLTTKSGKSLHEKSCTQNPLRMDGSSKGKKHSEEFKRRQSENMKAAYANGTRTNDGFKQRRNGNRSYPEKWWEQIIKNEIKDQDVEYEKGFGKYWLDFAWSKKQLCIEIDGQQHKRWNRLESDKQKDLYLESRGWKVLRIDWQQCCIDPNQYILIAKEFIDNGIIIPFEKRYKSKKEIHEEYIFQKYGVKKLSKEHSFLSTKEVLRRKTIINNYDKKWGWVTKCSNELNISHTQLKRFIKIYMK